MSKIFLDTNLFIYAVSPKDADRQQRAIAALARAATAPNIPVISTQVLQEFFAVATRKLGMDPRAAEREVRAMLVLEVTAFSANSICEAIALSIVESVHFRDALIVTAALSANCTELWSEDLQTGRRFGSLTILNPLL